MNDSILHNTETKQFTDQLGREITIAFPPQKIISLVPSQTEFLFDLGLDERIAGITKFCIHPEEKVKAKTKIGGTKNLNIDKIRSLNPDLIIANKEENEEQQIKELAGEFPVWISDIRTLDHAYAMMKTIGEMNDRIEIAGNLVNEIQTAVSRWELEKTHRKPLTGKQLLSAAYLIWYHPFMTVGDDTFIHHMMNLAGFDNIFSGKTRYPEITIEDLRVRNPEFILLSSEPYPFKQKHIDELQQELPTSKCILVDGEMFSWYGSRLLKVPGYFNHLSNLIISE